MKIAIFNPAITIGKILKALYVKGGRQFTEAWFRAYTGKKYILLTASCRNALYLAYKATELQGEVITTPLICYSALESAAAAGLTMHFCDLEPESILMDTQHIEDLITPNTRYIQATHQGGYMLDLSGISELADKHNIIVVEDCAQVFGASREGINPGQTGDIACFTLAKNSYGIGGGVFATDHAEFYDKAKAIQNSWPRFSRKLLAFRVLRSLLESKRPAPIFEKLYRILMHNRPGKREGLHEQGIKSSHYFRPSRFFFRLFKVQEPHFNQLADQTRAVAGWIEKSMEDQGLVSLIKGSPGSYAKLFFAHKDFHAPGMIPTLLSGGIEARHLENSFGSPRQPRIDEIALPTKSIGLKECKNYFYIYDKLVNLPLHHAMRREDTSYMVKTLKNVMHETDTL